MRPETAGLAGLILGVALVLLAQWARAWFTHRYPPRKVRVRHRGTHTAHQPPVDPPRTPHPPMVG